MSAGVSSTAAPFLRLRGVTKTFPGVTALAALELEVHRGELLALVGPSGCGKTTALRIMAGLETPDSGEVLAEGADVTRLDPGKRDVAMVFQDYALYPHLTVADNLSFGLRARRLPEIEVRSRVLELAETLQLQERLHHLPHELSGGEQQRAAIARALARRPALLLLDEPLANLDPGLRSQFRADLARLRARFAPTIVYVTHDQAEAMAVGDRIAVMRRGSLAQVGTPPEIYSRPISLFIAGFFGTPPMNFIAGRLLRQSDALFFEETGDGPDANRIRLKLPGLSPALLKKGTREVVLGIRPEHLLLSSLAPNAAGWGVDSVQFAGHEFHIVVQREGGSSLVARVAAAAQKIPAKGERVHLVLDSSQAVFFDPAGAGLA